MCTLFSNAQTVNAVEAFFAALSDLARPPQLPNSGFTPGEEIPVLLSDTRRMLTSRRWGWKKSDGGTVANARSETAGDKPFFARHADRHRCVVPADGFYEFRRANRTSPPWRFALRSTTLFGLAGLMNDDGEIVLLTTEPNACVRPIHNRMPVILPFDALSHWLDPQKPFRSLSDAWLAPWSETDTVACVPKPCTPPLVQTELFE